MEKISNYKQTLGVITLAAGGAAAACLLLGAHAVEYNFDAFGEPALTLQYAHRATIAYWFLLLDMAGYYLLLLPVIFYLHQQYKYRSPWVPLFTFSGLGYVLTGALGAAILAATWPELMKAYQASVPAEQPSIALLFTIITHLVTKGLWNMLEMLLAASWWIGFGWLMRRDHKAIGRLSLLAGTACLLNAVGTMAGWKMVAEIGVNIYLMLGIIWPLIVGLHLLRKSASEQLEDSAVPSFNQIERQHANA